MSGTSLPGLVGLRRDSARVICSFHAELEDDEAAIRYALGFEKDSILFLYEMKTMMREEDQPMVERLIAEEKSHVLRLHALLTESGATQLTDE